MKDTRKKLDLLIKNCSIITPGFDIEENMSIGVLGNTIEVIDNEKDVTLTYEARENINGYGKIALPGFIDSHMHSCQQLLRGRIADEFPMIWSRILVPFESSLEADDVYVSAKLCALEMIKSGTTAFAESGGPHMHAAIKAFDESGLRGMIARSTMDQGAVIPEIMKDSASESIKKTEALFTEFNGIGDGRIKIWFALRQVLTCSSKLIEMTANKAKEYGTGVHIHLEEHRDEVSYCLQNFKLRPAEYLDSLGLLGPNLIAAHSILMTDKEISLIAERGVSAVHCPRNNLNSHWIPRTTTLINAQANVALGTDGASGHKMDLFEEMKVLRSAIQAFYGIPLFDPVCMTAETLLRMVTQGGARAIMMADQLGKLQKNYHADIILVNIDQAHLSPSNNYINTLVDNASGSDVSDMIVNGKLLMKDREVLVFDEQKVIREAGVSLQKINVRAGL